MPKTLTFLHTIPAHIPTFDELLAAADENLVVRHVVRESLLREARARGITPQLEQRIAETVLAAFEQGTDMVVCTCSTIGGAAEAVGKDQARPVVRLDRPMAEQAVALGSRILIVATLESTVAPTRDLLLEVADDAGKPVRLDEALCESAWRKFETGDHESYVAEIEQTIRQRVNGAEVVVLAQASMAEAAARCADLPTPILSSPRLGLEAALAAIAAT